jgi:hypothetical protein
MRTLPDGSIRYGRCPDAGRPLMTDSPSTDTMAAIGRGPWFQTRIS